MKRLILLFLFLFLICASTSMAHTPQCADWIDNDGDFLADFEDPDCTDASDDDESSPPPPPTVCFAENLASANCNDVSYSSTNVNTNDVAGSCGGTDCTGTFLADCDANGNWTNIRDNCHQPPPPPPVPGSFPIATPLANFKATNTGNVTFAVLGSFKGSAAGNQIDWILANDPNIEGFISMGDMIKYASPGDFDPWRTQLAKFYNTHFHVPVAGNQEKRSSVDGTTFYSLYGLNSSAKRNYYFTLQVDNTTYTIAAITYKDPKLGDLMENLDDGTTKSWQNVLNDAGAAGHSIVVIGHRQWFDNCPGSKYYQPASPTHADVVLMDNNGVDLVLSGDNPGFCHQTNANTDYVRADGADITSNQSYRSYIRATLTDSSITLLRIATSPDVGVNVGDVTWSLTIPLN